MFFIVIFLFGIGLHRMPTAKKEKLEKVIKSVDKKKDVLSLECEWTVCDFVCKDTDSFLTHISHHIDQLTMSENDAACKNDAGKFAL